MADGWIKRKVIEPYFLEREMPFSKKRPIKLKSIYWSCGLALFLFLITVLFMDAGEEGHSPSVASSEPLSNITTTGAITKEVAFSDSQESVPGFARMPSQQIKGMVSRSENPQAHPRSANQVILRSGDASHSGLKLPLGTSIPVRILNQISTRQSASPVIAQILDDTYAPGDLDNSLVIPRGTRVIGSAHYDETAQRIQIQFSTLVFPEGDQHSIQGVALMSDGSSGVLGELHSGANLRRSGKFLGQFIGQMAKGMKERSGGVPGAIPYEPGSLKNGILNGIQEVATDEAKEFSQDLSQTQPSMSLAPGQTFILFLEREFTP